jgi:hypothetical protein
LINYFKDDRFNNISAFDDITFQYSMEMDDIFVREFFEFIGNKAYIYFLYIRENVYLNTTISCNLLDIYNYKIFSTFNPNNSLENNLLKQIADATGSTNFDSIVFGMIAAILASIFL